MSPSCFFHAATFPLLIVGDSAGIGRMLCGGRAAAEAAKPRRTRAFKVSLEGWGEPGVGAGLPERRIRGADDTAAQEVLLVLGSAVANPFSAPVAPGANEKGASTVDVDSRESQCPPGPERRASSATAMSPAEPRKFLPSTREELSKK